MCHNFSHHLVKGSFSSRDSTKKNRVTRGIVNGNMVYMASAAELYSTSRDTWMPVISRYSIHASSCDTGSSRANFCGLKPVLSLKSFIAQTQSRACCRSARFLFSSGSTSAAPSCSFASKCALKYLSSSSFLRASCNLRSSTNLRLPENLVLLGLWVAARRAKLNHRAGCVQLSCRVRRPHDAAATFARKHELCAYVRVYV